MWLNFPEVMNNNHPLPSLTATVPSHPHQLPHPHQVLYLHYNIYSIYTADISSISTRARMPSWRQCADCAAAWSLGLSRVVQPSFCTDPFPIGTKEWKYPVDRYISLTTAGVMTPRQTPIIYWAPIPEHIHIQHLQGEISTLFTFLAS